MLEGRRITWPRNASWQVVAACALAACSGSNGSSPDAGPAKTEARPEAGSIDSPLGGPLSDLGSSAETSGEARAGGESPGTDAPVEEWPAGICDDPESEACAAACANASYGFVKRALRARKMPTSSGGSGGEVEVLLVPRLDPRSDVPSARLGVFANQYPIVAAAVVVPLLIEAGDTELAAKILEFYFQLFEDPASHPELWKGQRFDGFPDVYEHAAGRADAPGAPGPHVGTADAGAADRVVRSAKANAWLANAILYYEGFLRSRAQPGDARESARARSVAEAIGGWLGYLQDQGLDAWLADQKSDRTRSPWFEGAIAGALDEATRQVVRGPDTASGAVVYAVWRKLENLSQTTGDVERASVHRARAERLGAWFRRVVDGATGQVLAGRMVDGRPAEATPGVVAESVEAYGLLVLAGIPDADLQKLMLDRIGNLCAERNVADRAQNQLSGLAFGPEAENAIFWNAHARVDMAAWFAKHSSETLLRLRLRAGGDKCRLPIFSPDQAIDEFALVRGESEGPREPAWIGFPGMDAVEPTAWLAMRDKLAAGFNILGPVTWSPTVKAADALLGTGPRATVLCKAMGAPSGPYADASSASYLGVGGRSLVLEKAEEENDCRPLWYLHVEGSDGGVSTTVDGGADGADRALVLSYGPAGARFEDVLSFFMNASPGITHMELELKDGAGKNARFVIPLFLGEALRKVVLDLKGGAGGLDLKAIQQVLLHVRGQGLVKLDGLTSGAANGDAA